MLSRNRYFLAAAAAAAGTALGVGALRWGSEGLVGALFLSAMAVALAQQTLPWGPNAVFGIASSDVGRNQHSHGWKPKLLLFVAVATASGAATGALLGLAGSAVSAQTRVGFATLLGAIATALGLWEAVGPRLALLQCNRETPQEWVSRGPFRWALRNGAALGFAAGTRLGFALWYVVPAGAFLLGSPSLGACVYGLFAATRTLGAGMLMLAGRYKDDFELVTEWLFARAAAVRCLAASQLVVVGLGVTIGVGL